MQKIKAILVDDERRARDVLENLLLRFCPEIELVAKCENVVQAVEVIKKENPQLVFLDIEMPNYAGFEIVDFFTEVNFQIIFVTAYDKYAIRAFEIAAIDYVLKPIDIQRLKSAIEKCCRYYDKHHLEQRLSLLTSTLESKQLKNIAVSDKGKQHIIAIDDIIAIEAQESYCTIYTSERKYMVSKKLKQFEILFESLPKFIRTHKSWIVNKSHLKDYSKSNLLIYMNRNVTAKLSKYKKTEFEECLLYSE